MFSSCLKACCLFNTHSKNSNVPLKPKENLIYFDNQSRKIGEWFFGKFSGFGSSWLFLGSVLCSLRSSRYIWGIPKNVTLEVRRFHLLEVSSQLPYCYYWKLIKIIFSQVTKSLSWRMGVGYVEVVVSWPMFHYCRANLTSRWKFNNQVKCFFSSFPLQLILILPFPGHWSVGLATMSTDLNKPRGGQDRFSWCLNAENMAMHDNQILHNLNEMYSSEHPAADNDKEQLIPSNEVRTAILPTTPVNRPFLPQEGDILGVTYNHEEMNFYLNGKSLNIPIFIKMQNAPSSSENNSTEIYPAVHVDDGAILDLIVDNFNYPIPGGYDKIMIEQSLL